MEVENEAGAEHVFQCLAREMANFSSAFNAQVVQCFDCNPKYLRNLVKRIEKYSQFTSFPEATKKLVAYQSMGKGL